MREIGFVKFLSIRQMLQLAEKILTNSSILQALFCQTIAFLAFVSVLSFADISFVRPATALTYPMSLLGAKFFFNETITRGRFLGIIIVGAGIALMAFDYPAN